jgi:hypothetical protein
VSIGNRNPIASDDEFLTAFDARFPTYAKPATVGFSLAPGAFTTQSFQVTIPTGVEKTGYFGNSVLLQISFHDVGQYLDRGCFSAKSLSEARAFLLESSRRRLVQLTGPRSGRGLTANGAESRASPALIRN